MIIQEDKLAEHIQGLDNRVEYGMVVLSFGALALSMQYSPAMGTVTPWLLIGSWGSLFMAGFLSGLKMTFTPDVIRFKLFESMVERKRVEIFVRALPEALQSEPRVDLSKSGEFQEETQKLLTEYERAAKRYDGIVNRYHSMSMFLLPLGLGLQVLFAVNNYLAKVNAADLQIVDTPTNSSSRHPEPKLNSPITKALLPESKDVATNIKPRSAQLFTY